MTMRRFAWLAAGMAVMIGIAALFGYRSARSDPIVRRATVELPRWPAGAAPVTVALLSDIHIGSPAMDGDRLTRIVAQVNALRPDLVVIAGDFIFGHGPDNGRRFAPGLVTPLSELRAPLGTIAVLGNHDWWTGAEPVRSALHRAGIVVVENAAVRRGPLTIGVIGDHLTHHDRVGAAATAMQSLGGVPVMLTHGPDIAPSLPADIPLLLAGHTHCGQGVLFGHTLGYEPYERRYRCGIVREGGRTTIVTGGLGTSAVPFRIGAPPDLWLLTLRGRGS